MRRSEIINGATEVLTAINKSQIYQSLKLYRKGRIDEEITRRLIKSLKEYAIKASNFSPAAQKLSEILGIEIVTHENFWSQLFSEAESDDIFQIRNSLYQTTHILPKILKLLENEVIHELNEPSEKQNSKYKDKALLSVIISEPDDRFSTPERLVEALESINLFYEVFAIVNNQNANDLSVVACDSGSDKSFDFLGAAKIIECVKDLIITLWDRVVFFREKKHHERLVLIAESLPIIDYIATLQNDKKLEPEQAEILKRKVLKGTEKFISSGAIIPEMEKESIHNPHLLMTPEPKLLVSAPEEIEHKQPAKKKQVDKTKSEEQENEDFEDFSPEELEVLKKLAGKMPKANTKTTQTRRTVRKKTINKKS